MKFKLWYLIISIFLFNCENKVEMLDEKINGNVREIHTYGFQNNNSSILYNGVGVFELKTNECNSKTVDSFNTNGQKLKTILFQNEVIFRNGGLVRDENNRPKKDLFKLYEFRFIYDDKIGLTKMTWTQKLDDITNSSHSEFFKKDRNIIGELIFDINRNLVSKTYFHLDNNNITKLSESYDRDSNFVSKVEYKLNDKGNIVSMKNLNSKGIMEKETTFTYLKYDEKGNWLKRRTSESAQIKSVQIRDIFYYPN